MFTSSLLGAGNAGGHIILKIIEAWQRGDYLGVFGGICFIIIGLIIYAILKALISDFFENLGKKKKKSAKKSVSNTKALEKNKSSSQSINIKQPKRNEERTIALQKASNEITTDSKSQNTSAPKNATPATTSYYVAIAGQCEGPFNLSQIKVKVNEGIVTRDTLIWKKGMADWDLAETFEELSETLIKPLGSKINLEKDATITKPLGSKINLEKDATI